MLINLTDDSDLCTTVTVLSYNTFTCQVAPGAIVNTNTALKGYKCLTDDVGSTTRCKAGYRFE